MLANERGRAGLLTLLQDRQAFRPLHLQNKNTRPVRSCRQANVLTGPASSGRLVCAPGPMSFFIVAQINLERSANYFSGVAFPSSVRVCPSVANRSIGNPVNRLQLLERARTTVYRLSHGPTSSNLS
jgi:hypothetical protein